MTVEFHREYLVRLPLPLAQLYSRAHNASEARGRHDNCFYLFEALIKLASCPLIAAYAERVVEGGRRVESLDEQISRLALPSLGHWLAIVRSLAKHFSEADDGGPLTHVSDQLTTKHDDRPGILQLYRRIKHGPEGESTGDKSCSLLALFDALVHYRNTVFGHGAGRATAFYDQQMWPLFFPAVNDVLAEGVLDFLGPPGSTLVYLGDLRATDESMAELGWRELTGLQSQRMEPLKISRGESSRLAPHRVAVRWPGRKLPLSLAPLVLYQRDDKTEEVLILNRDRDGRQAEYLSYASGNTLKDTSTAVALSHFLDLFENSPTGAWSPSDDAPPNATADFQFAGSDYGQQTIAAGTQLGQYQLLDKLGEGGMGEVYKALHVNLKTTVAVKLLSSSHLRSNTAVARFYREMEAIGRLEHPHVVRARDAGSFDGVHCLVMDYVDGIDLARLVRATGPLPMADACELIRQAAIGLQYIHEHGLVHRDIKPSNLMLARDGKVKIMDLGLARLSDEADVPAQLTSAGMAIGTIDYMAPEQATGDTGVDIRSDIYALGCTFYHLLDGNPPFSGPQFDSIPKKLMAHAQVAPRPVEEKRDDVPSVVGALISSMLAKEPRQRLHLPTEVAERLSEFTKAARLDRLLENDGLNERPSSFMRSSVRIACGLAETTNERTVTPAPQSLHPRPIGNAPRKKRWYLAIVIAVCIGATAITLAIRQSYNDETRIVKTEPGNDGRTNERTDNVREAAPDWPAPFDTKPQILEPPGQSSGATIEFDETRQALRQFSEGISLVRLGVIPNQPCTVAIEIERLDWRKSAGLFFGYHIVDAKTPYARFQLIRLADTAEVGKNRFVERSLATIHPTFGTIFAPNATPCSQPLPYNKRSRLEVVIGKQGIEMIRLDGEPIPELVAGQVSANYSVEDCMGVWGTFNEVETIWLSNPKFTVHDAPEE